MKKPLQIPLRIIKGLGIFAIALCCAFVFLEFYARATGKEIHSTWIKRMFPNYRFSTQHLYWQKSVCELTPDDCYFPEEEVLTHLIEIYPEDLQHVYCEEERKVLLLGGRTIDIPDMELRTRLFSRFAQQMAQTENICVKLMRLAVGGTSSDQQYEVFKNVYQKIQPDIVIWVFFFDDLYNNSEREIYTVKEGKLFKKPIWKNSFFLSGMTVQTFPFLRNTAIGEHIMYSGENLDPFQSKPTIPDASENTLQYHSKKLQLFLSEIEKLTNEDSFRFFTALTPLECDTVPGIECDDFNSRPYQEAIRRVLINQGSYLAADGISPEEKKISSVSAGLNPRDSQYFFKLNDGQIGGMHELTVFGNAYFAQKMYESYKILVK